MNCHDVIFDPADSEGMKEHYKRTKKSYEVIAIFAILVFVALIFFVIHIPYPISHIPYPGHEERGKWVVGGFFIAISLFTILMSILALRQINHPFQYVICRDGLRTPGEFIPFKKMSYIKIIKNNRTTNIIFYPKERTSLIRDSLFEIGEDWYYHPEYICALKKTGVPIRFEDRSTRIRPEQWEIEELWPYKTEQKEWANSWRPAGEK